MLLASAQTDTASGVSALLVRAAAANQDGRSSALTAPNGRAQQAVILAALDAACVSPAVLSLVQVSGRAPLSWTHHSSPSSSAVSSCGCPCPADDVHMRATAF